MALYLSPQVQAGLKDYPEPAPNPQPQGFTQPRFDEGGNAITPSVFDPSSFGGGGRALDAPSGPVGFQGPVGPPPEADPFAGLKGMFGGVGDALGGIGSYIGGQFQDNPFLNPLTGSTGPGQALTNTRQFLNTNPISNAVGDPLVKFASDPRVQIASQAIFSPDILTPDMPVPPLSGIRRALPGAAAPEVAVPSTSATADRIAGLSDADVAAANAQLHADVPNAGEIDRLGLPDPTEAEQARLQALLDATKPADATVPADGPAFRSDGTPITPENPLTPDESTAEQQRLQAIIDAHDQRYGGVAAQGRQPLTDEERAAFADRPPLTADEIAAGNDAAFQRSIHDPYAASVDSLSTENPAARPTPAQLPPDAPPQDLLQAGLDQGVSLWAQRKQAVSQLVRSQAARYEAAFARAGGGEAGDRAGLAAMKGNVAEQPTFTPLQEVYSPQQIASLYKGIDDAGLQTYDGITARGALRGMVEKGIPPTPSELEALAKVMPDLPAQLTRLGVYDVPPTSLAQAAKRGALDFLNGLHEHPIQTLNNSARSIETIGDMAAPGRLAPTAGAFMPKVYAESLGDLGKIEFAKDPKAVINGIWDGIRADPEMRALGITPEDMFDKDTGFAMHGAGTDPYSGDLQAGGGMGLLKGSQRAQLLSNWMQVLRPQMLREHILNTIAGAGDEAAQAAMKQRIMNDVAFRQDLGHSIDLITGHSAWRPFGDEAQLLVNFGNWFAAQGELIAKGAVGGLKGAANVLPGVDIPVSSTEAVARTALGRLAALGTMATVAINGINGVDPRDPRASRNGIPMVVITKPFADNLSNVPVIGRLLHFVPNTQQDIYGPIGEYLQHAAGVGVGAVKGATTTPGTALDKAVGAAKGAGNEATYWGRGLLAWVPGVINNLFIAKDNFGQPNTLANNLPLPFNVSGIVGDNPRELGVQIGSSLGGRFHEPSTKAQVAAGTLDYQSLSPTDQFKEIPTQSWKLIVDHAPAELKADVGQYQNLYDWYAAKQDEYAKGWEQRGLAPAEAQLRAEQSVQGNPIYKAYLNAKNHTEDEWYTAHPAEGQKYLETQMQLPPSERKNLPTRVQQDIIAHGLAK